MTDPAHDDVIARPAAPGAFPLACLCYVSAATRLFAASDLEALLGQSRSRNATLGLTGLLLYCDGSFMQYLEGPRAGLDAVWQSIQRDPRHKHVSLVFQAEVAARRFADWRMAFRATDRPDFESLVEAARADAAPAHETGDAVPRMVADLLRHFWDIHQPGRR